MQNFTQDDYRPNASTILFVKQFARMYNTMKKQENGYHSISIAACC